MTAPVMDTLSSSGKHIVAFTMPSSYTLDTLPKSNNANIRFRSVNKSRRAVLEYSWYATESRVAAKQKLLEEFLIHDKYSIK